MANNLDPAEILKGTLAILNVLKVDPSIKISRKPQADISGKADRLQQLLQNLIPSAERALATLSNERDDLVKALNADRTAGLSVVRGAFGPDSDEYEQAGGTRTSERARPIRKKTPPKA